VVDVMMARMVEPVQTGGSVGRMPALVGSYARRVTPAVLAEHRGASVSSALGVWLLLAACASAATGSSRAELEEALGCPAKEASRLLATFMADPPPALHAAIALWVAVNDATAELASWTRGLPEVVESGFMPSQGEADAWAGRETQGLIRRFPMSIDENTRVVLASALATKVQWEVPFDVVPAGDHCGPDSPWRGSLVRMLWDPAADGHAEIARSEAAGLVAVHCAAAHDGLTVVSVSGAPDVDRSSVLAAAYEVAATVCGGWGRDACSLFDVPLGVGHSWEISEREVPVFVAEPRRERMAGVALPAWRVEDKLDLLRSPAFATAPALETLRTLIGPRPDDRCEATQAAVAAFGRHGFEAAAVTALGIRTAAMRRPQAQAVERRAVLRFDHPYAAVAIAGRPMGPRSRFDAPSSPDTSFPGLPLFAAWVHEPVEPEAEPRR
jgi:hypothetical protein